MDHNTQLCIYKDISNKHAYLSVKKKKSHFHLCDKRRIAFLKITGNFENTMNIWKGCFVFIFHELQPFVTYVAVAVTVNYYVSLYKILQLYFNNNTEKKRL